MPINAASRSINLPDEIAEKHDVQFLVYSRLAVPEVEQLKEHFDGHLRVTKSLIETGVMPISGSFFTPDGKNTGNGFYVLRVDNLEEGRRLAERAISDRAYAIWCEKGRPEGQDREHWLTAEQEHDARGASTDGVGGNGQLSPKPVPLP